MKVTQLCLTLCNPMDCNPPCPLSIEFPKQEYWSGSPFPSPGDLPDPGIEPGFPALQADSLPTELLGKPIHTHKTTSYSGCETSSHENSALK